MVYEEGEGRRREEGRRRAVHAHVIPVHRKPHVLTACHVTNGSVVVCAQPSSFTRSGFQFLLERLGGLRYPDFALGSLHLRPSFRSDPSFLYRFPALAAQSPSPTGCSKLSPATLGPSNQVRLGSERQACCSPGEVGPEKAPGTNSPASLALPPPLSSRSQDVGRAFGCSLTMSGLGC